ncbi:4-hydroxyproline epimerase [Robertkochia marina]|uniref:4-hydroxyproline epimerase n=1 Tax=Robertkochia marina TaxID=1227945 RepID=A0A4V3UYK3_9FLAO|nr:4-hydroxyproline epimerase [Robertkochia marina]THD69998.1 4-hydroxyproline epimerase [Robertkochia marina]TRZ44934.1 4-hydroxyproline epimerase [Robertkochia marina]
MTKKKFFCIDAHTCGNPVRVVASGAPVLEGDTMSERRQHFIREYDWIRKGLMYEPRGHDQMSGSIIYPPLDPENDFSIIFIETSGSLPMCGHGTIGTITVVIEEGLVTPKTPGKIRMEAPAGLVEIDYEMVDGKVTWVALKNVASFVIATNLTVTSQVLGELHFDVAYGGNFYAIFDPQKNFKGIEHYSASELIAYSQELRALINERYPDRFIHPENPTINKVSHLLWTGKTISPEATGRNAVFYGDKAIDRSPCGTGTSARMAQWHQKEFLKKGDTFIHESFIGSVFEGTIAEETRVGSFPAIHPEIKGWARVYGYNHIILDPEDPYVEGFQVI